MIRRDRHGWRVLIVLSRLAVALILIDSGPPGLTGRTIATAQTGRPKSPPPPPRPLDETSRSTPHAQPTKTGSPPNFLTHAADAAQPTPAADLIPKPDVLRQIVLPSQPSLEKLIAERTSLNQFLYRDRRHRLLLSRGDQALSSGDFNLALLHYQAVVDASSDAFYWPDDSVQPGGVQSTAQLRLRALPEDVRQDYERRHGAEARALLEQAVRIGDRRAIQEVLKRFRLTDAGREVMIREMLIAYDRGQLMRASQFARMLGQDPHHRRQLSSHIQAIVDRASSFSETDTFGSFPFVDVFAQTVSPPSLRPQWTRSLIEGVAADEASDTLPPAEDVGACVEEAIVRWQHEHEDRRLPITTSNEAIVVNRLVLIRDYSGIQALDLETGRSVWSFRCAGSLRAAAQTVLREEARGGGAPPLSFHAHFAGRGSRGRLSTDRQRVFFIDRQESEQPEENADGRSTPQHASNRLVALRIETSESSDVPRTAWVRGGRSDGHEDSLFGHFFLGPPLPVDGRLFVLSEFDGRLHCTALNAQTGRTHWQQPIALLERAIDWDTSRQLMSCSPAAVGHLIVCPTEVGVLVAMDPLTGALDWIYDHIDEDQRHTAGRWSSSAQRVLGNTEFPSRMLTRQGRVYYLPFRSANVHCIDAATGKNVWKKERRDALGLSAMTEQTIVLTGPRDVTALSAANGSLLWKTTCPEPAGHGLIAGDQFLLPIRDGRCLALSMSDGTITGSRFGRLLQEICRPPAETPEAHPSRIQLVAHEQTDSPKRAFSASSGGNLLAADEFVVMATPTNVAVFPQARPLLRSLSAEADNAALAPRRLLEAAMLHLLLGERPQAKRRLRALYSDNASPEIRQTALRLSREILFRELESADDPRPILDQLLTISTDDPDYLRLQIGRINAELKLGDPARLIDAVKAFSRTDADSFVRPDSESELLVRASAFVSDRLSLARHSAGDGVRAALDDYVSAETERVVDSNDPVERERLLSLFGDWPEAARLRNAAAESHLQTQHVQQAELLLLRNRTSPDRAAAARARALLANVYAEHGLQFEAAASLYELLTDYRDQTVAGDLTSRQFVDQLPQDHPVRLVLRRRRFEPPPAYHVRITERICGDQCAAPNECRSAVALQQHDRIRRKFLLGDDATLTVIDRGIVPGDRNHSQLTLLNRETGQVHGELRLPAAYWQLAAGNERRVGQLLPTSGRTAHGLSLLENRSIWSTADSADGYPRDKIKLGPLGTEYCVLQTPRRLSVVDPGTGRLLWERTNLPPNTGLLANESTGIIGDGETLTLFAADATSYTVYRMRSGSLVRHGRLAASPTDARRYRHAVGAKLVYLASTSEHETLRIWDAHSDRHILEQPLRDELFYPVGSGSQYALISPEGRFLIVDVATGGIELDVPIPEEHLTEVTDLAVTFDRDHYFVNLVGCSHDALGETSAAMDEVEIPGIRVRGRLTAVSRSGRLLWQQPIAESVLLTGGECSLPVLTLVSRVRDVQNRQASRLRIDVLDVRSGETLARRDDLLRTRIVRSVYHPRPGKLTLVGLNSQIDVEFGPRRRDFLIHAEIDEPGDTLIR